MIKKFKDLNLNSAFLFAAAANDPETCQLLLELILGRKIPKVSVKTEHNILLSSDAKCIRLDVNARSEFEVNYNIEAQNSKDGNIVKRSRFYQGQMDVAELKPGDDYNRLPESFVIFICTFDPFDRGLYRYTFTERCEEDGEPLGDGTCKIFLNTKGKNPDEVSKELITFLGYFEESTDEYVERTNNSSIKRLHEKIVMLKKSREWEEGYMQLEELLMRQQRIAREEGRVQGHKEGLKEGLDACRKSILTILSTKGEVSSKLQEAINNENSVEKLGEWLEKALVVTSTEEFEKEILDK